MDPLQFALSIFAALLMGIAIGVERQLGQHPAGLRTNTLVCVGAAIFVSLSRILIHDGDSTRVAGQVASGIGFLGGGVILREGISVRGLNTAATLWCSAAVGTLAGAGLLIEGAIGSLSVLAVNLMLHPLVRCLDRHAKKIGNVETAYRFQVVCKMEQAALVRSICLRHVHSVPDMLIQGISTKDIEGTNQVSVVVQISSAIRKDSCMNELVGRLSIEECVSSSSWERLT